MFTPEQYAEYLYNLLPKIYRDEDIMQGETLKKYLYSLFIGGSKLSIEDINSSLSLISPTKCPSEYFIYLCKSFDRTYNYGIDESYQRKFVSSIGELSRRGGTYSSIRYLTQVLTGMDVDMAYERGYNNSVFGRWLYITLKARTIEEYNNMDTSVATLQAFLSSRTPFYISTQINFSLLTQQLNVSGKKSKALSVGVSYTLIPSS